MRPEVLPVLSVSMFRTLREAAHGNLVAQANHPSVRVLERHGYIERLGEVERRNGRYVVFAWRVTEGGRQQLAGLNGKLDTASEMACYTAQPRRI